jgi:RHS repeat-associated protein
MNKKEMIKQYKQTVLPMGIYRIKNTRNGKIFIGSANVTGLSVYTFAYDGENRQTSTTHGGITTTYSYDGEGRRVMKTQGTSTTHVYDASGQLAAEYSAQPNQSPCATCYLTADHLGSTRMMTDGNGTQVALHDYLPFGEEIPAAMNGRNGLYGGDEPNQKFTGKERDVETGLDFFGARYFSGAQGRFTSPDPKVITWKRLADPQQWNAYAYVRNNPFAFVDPDGCELVRVLVNNQQVVVDRTIAIDVVRFMRASRVAGFSPRVTSGFRSNAQQQTMYEEYLAARRRHQHHLPVARPGHSAHNSGEAIDVGILRWSSADQQSLGTIGNAQGLPWAGLRDVVHFGAGFEDPINQALVGENNADPNPTATIVEGADQSVTANAVAAQLEIVGSEVPNQLETTPGDGQTQQPEQQQQQIRPDSAQACIADPSSCR